jgi:hypothetical protein
METMSREQSRTLADSVYQACQILHIGYAALALARLSECYDRAKT